MKEKIQHILSLVATTIDLAKETNIQRLATINQLHKIEYHVIQLLADLELEAQKSRTILALSSHDIAVKICGTEFHKDFAQIEMESRKYVERASEFLINGLSEMNYLDDTFPDVMRELGARTKILETLGFEGDFTNHYVMPEEDFNSIAINEWAWNEFGPYRNYEAAKAQLVAELLVDDADTKGRWVIANDQGATVAHFWMKNSNVYEMYVETGKTSFVFSYNDLP